MQHLLENSDLGDLDLKLSNHDLAEQAELVHTNQLDLAAFVMDENAEMIRKLVTADDLDIVAPPAIDGLTARDRWLRLGKIPAGYYDVTRQIPATDKDVAQVDTLIMTNACVGRAERVAVAEPAQRGVPELRARQPAAVAEVSGRGAAGRRSARVLRQRAAGAAGPVFPEAREPDVAGLLDLSGDGG